MKQIKKTAVFFALLLGLISKAQTKYSIPAEDFVTYHANLYDAERMYKNDSLLQAYAKFALAFENYKGTIHPSHYFKAALCALKIKEEFKALDFLEKAIVNGYEIDSSKKTLIVFYNQNTKKEYQENIANWEAKGTAERNTNWENELYESIETSKKYNTPSYKTAIQYCTKCLQTKTCSKTAPEFTSKYKLVKEKMKADSMTAIKLLSNIDQYGFPNMKLINKKACEAARAILLNYDADKKNEHMDAILFKALTNGQISPLFYATVVDKRNAFNNRPLEFYEPLAGYEKTIGKDLTVINQKRNKIGLYNVIMPNTNASKAIDSKKTKTYSKLFANLYDY